MRRSLSGRCEVIFFNFMGSGSAQSQPTLVPLSLRLLSEAAMAYADDDETLTFLLRSASRLKNGNQSGYALLNEERVPLHFGWTSEFDKVWISELGRTLSQPQPNSVLIYDCWTPICERGRGRYSQSLQSIAEQIQERGAIPWIFSAAQNHGSVRGIERAGFVRRFSVTHQTRFAFLHQWRETRADDPGQVMNFNTAA
jgi:hypothetical protein